MTSTFTDVQRELEKKANKEKAVFLGRYFKTGKGEYGEGDVFLGITVPEQRKIALRFVDLSLSDIAGLLKSGIHEHRFTALEILVMKYEKADPKEQKEIVKLYLSHTRWINNWDLVDTSAQYILGQYLADKDLSVLYKLARSKNIWERRIAIIATHHFINQNDFADTLNIAELLLADTHDLIHKAVGWMLREVGNKSIDALKSFLNIHYKTMPRTMLRYAIEKFPEELRKKYLKGEVVVL